MQGPRLALVPAIEQLTPLSRDIEICVKFGKWPSEFLALGQEEQEVLRLWYSLNNGREGYRDMPKEDRRHWPGQAPPKPKVVPRRS